MAENCRLNQINPLSKAAEERNFQPSLLRFFWKEAPFYLHYFIQLILLNTAFSCAVHASRHAPCFWAGRMKKKRFFKCYGFMEQGQDLIY